MMPLLCLRRYLSDSAEGMLASYVAEPSQQRSRIGAALVSALL